MMKSNNTTKGITLIELMIALALSGLFLMLVADMARRYKTVLLHQQEKNRTVEIVQTALMGVASEIEQSIRSIDPDTPSETLTSLTLERYNPKDASKTLTIQYYLNNKTLYRQVVGQSATKTPLAGGIESFAVTCEQSRYYKVHLTLSTVTNPNRMTINAFMRTRI
jgi:prepilin-type N-terminal cleavage/methylation domain-containing protein